MTWVCPRCGFENESEGRTAFSEQPCLRCRAERISADDLQKKYETEINEWKKELTRTMEVIEGLREIESDLCDDLSSIRIRIKDAIKEKNEALSEIDQLENFFIYRERVRQIAEDQKTLSEWIEQHKDGIMRFRIRDYKIEILPGAWLTIISWCIVNFMAGLASSHHLDDQAIYFLLCLIVTAICLENVMVNNTVFRQWALNELKKEVD